MTSSSTSRSISTTHTIRFSLSQTLEQEIRNDNSSPCRCPVTYIGDKRKAWGRKEPLSLHMRPEPRGTTLMTYSTKLVCPIQRTMAMIADKWKVIVIANLGDGTKR